MQKELLNGEPLRNHAVRVALYRLLLIKHLLIGFFDFTFIDGLVAYHPGDFFHNIVVGCQSGQGCEAGHRREDSTVDFHVIRVLKIL